jgi:hypothetical protein
MAGILTRLGLTDQISNNLGWAYANPTGWNDLGSSAYPSDTSGSNTDSPSPSSCGKLCTVGTGWDGPSGMGTPNGTVLAKLAGDPVPPPMSDDAGAPDDEDSGSSTPPGSGTGTSTPPPGSGTGTGDTTTQSTPPPGTLGAACSGPSDCNTALCAEAMTGSPAVCTEMCTTSCPAGFACTSGYCFAAGPILPPVLATADGGAGADDSGGSTGGGCTIAHDDSSPWTGIVGLTLGLAFVGSRRRRRG